jgi:hypothetical protein
VLAQALAIGIAPLASAQSPVAAGIDCDSAMPKRLALPPSPQALHLLPSTWPAQAVLEVREDGQDVTLHVDAVVQRSVQVPPRYGITWLRVERASDLRIERVRAGKGQGAIDLRLHCDATAAERNWSWAAEAGAIAVHIKGGVGGFAERFPEAPLNALGEHAFDPFSRALASHLRAQTLLLAGRSAEAADAFIASASGWSGAGEPARANAALVGSVEDLNRSGKYARVLEIARRSSGRPDGSNYFGIRLENARCLALHYLRRFDEAAQCYAWVSERYDALDETLELASAGIDYAALERSRSRTDAARGLLQGSIELAQGPQSRTVRARGLFELAMLDRDQGEFASALDRLRQAQQLFDEAGERRWEANVLLHLGALLNQLRAHGDARSAARLALAAFDEVNAPARVAASNVLLARIALAEGAATTGVEAAANALTAYRRLDMHEEVAQTALLLARLQADAGLDAQAGASLRSLPENSLTEALRVESQQLQARLALDAAAPESARILLAPSRSPMTWRQRIEQERLRAVADWQAGKVAQAHAALLAQADQMTRLADGIGNALLAHLLQAGVDDLRRTAVDLIARELTAAGADPDAAIEHLAAWLLAALHTPAGRGARRESGNDAALASALLADVSPSRRDGTATHAATRALLERLTRPDQLTGGPSRAVGKVSAISLQRLAEPGRPVLVLMPGRRSTLRLQFVEGGQPQIAVVDPSALRMHLAVLREHLGRPDGDLAVIDREARVLSSLLLGGFVGAPPAHLYVLADPLASSVPWPVLYWPSSEEPLVATTRVTLVSPQASAPRALSGSGPIDVLIAAQGEASGLPSLTSAAWEPALIEHAVPAQQVRAAPLDDRMRLLGTLGESGAWLHVAAHGLTRSRHLLASGIWLDRAQGGDVDFLSWADVLERGVAADLVVLNACQLAPGDPVAASAALDFAASLSRAGAQHIVAAQWPVSDTASAVWVPAFYRALAADGGQPDVAFALAEARRALRASRAFRHPFHWAGWVHLRRVAMAQP